MTRFIHTADWQLGMTRHFLSPEAQGRFAQDRIDAIRQIGRLAREQAAEFVVVCGDVFESNQVERQTVVRALDAMASIPVPVLLLPGNHDALDAVSVYRSPTFESRRPDNVIVLDSNTPIVPPGCSNVEVVGAPWTSKRPLCDLIELAYQELPPTATPRAAGDRSAATPSEGRIRVMVGHGGVDALSPDRGDPSLIGVAQAEAALQQGRIHYLALGDRHSVTSVGSSQRIWYSGSPVATDFSEVRPGFALCVEIASELAATPRVQEFPIGHWRFLEPRFALDCEDDVAALRDWLESQPDKERAVVRLILVGSLNLRAHAMLQAAMADFEDVFASLHSWQRHEDLAVLPDDLDQQALSLSGYARETWKALALAAQSAVPAGARAPEGSDDPAREARDALALLYRLGGGRSGSASA